MMSLSLNENLLSQADCVVITTAHSSHDYEWIVGNAKLIVDTGNATKNLLYETAQMIAHRAHLDAHK